MKNPQSNNDRLNAIAVGAISTTFVLAAVLTPLAQGEQGSYPSQSDSSSAITQSFRQAPLSGVQSSVFVPIDVQGTTSAFQGGSAVQSAQNSLVLTPGQTLALQGVMMLSPADFPREGALGGPITGITIRYSQGAKYHTINDYVVELDSGEIFVSVKSPSKMAMVKTPFGDLSINANSDALISFKGDALNASMRREVFNDSVASFSGRWDGKPETSTTAKEVPQRPGESFDNYMKRVAEMNKKKTTHIVVPTTEIKPDSSGTIHRETAGFEKTLSDGTVVGVLRVTNLDGSGTNIKANLNKGHFAGPADPTVTVAAGYELVASDKPLTRAQLRPRDGVARRHFQVLEKGYMAISEISVESVLKANDVIADVRQSASGVKERRIMGDLSKMAAILNYKNGTQGFSVEE